MSEWISTDDRLPDYNRLNERRVPALLDGWTIHSDVTWNRQACEFIRHWPPGTEGTDANGWVMADIEKACAANDAESLWVTYWSALPDSPPAQQKDGKP